MVTRSASPPGPRRIGTSRRDFLTVGSAALAGLTLPGLLRARDAVTKSGSTSKSTSIVWLWLAGGPSQIETFDPKPDAPIEYRSVTGSIETNLSGVRVGGTFPLIAKAADKLAFVRSFAHTDSGHGGGTHYVMTGHDYPAADNGASPNRPGLGAILSRYRGATNDSGIPTYIRSRDILADGPAWLGRAFGPLDVAGPARANMTLRDTPDALADRRALLHAFDKIDRDIDRSGLMHGLDAFEAQAFDLIRGAARTAFDVSLKNPRTRDKYGPGLGEKMLVARRLCEAGAGFVTVHFGGWDMHGSIADGMNKVGPAVDRAVRAFVDDLAERGASDDILLVITGEFGRTPKLNSAAGRDHWAPLSTLALAGGGLKMGQVVGESTARAEAPKGRPVTPQDLMATVFHVLGVPPDLTYPDPTGRPVRMMDDGKVIRELA